MTTVIAEHEFQIPDTCTHTLFRVHDGPALHLGRSVARCASGSTGGRAGPRGSSDITTCCPYRVVTEQELCVPCTLTDALSRIHDGPALHLGRSVARCASGRECRCALLGSCWQWCGIPNCGYWRSGFTRDSRCIRRPAQLWSAISQRARVRIVIASSPFV